VGAGGGCCLCDADCVVGAGVGTIKGGEAERKEDAEREDTGVDCEDEEAGRGGGLPHPQVF
jgi:hypothetical protein